MSIESPAGDGGPSEHTTVALVRVAVERFGVDPASEPNRTIAIVADLAAQPGQSSAPLIQTLRTTLDIAAATGGAVAEDRRSRCLEHAVAAGVDAELAAGVFEIIVTENAPPAPPPPVPEPTAEPVGRPGVRLGAIAAGAVIAVAIAVVGVGAVLALRSDPDSAAPETTTAPAVVTSQVGTVVPPDVNPLEPTDTTPTDAAPADTVASDTAPPDSVTNSSEPEAELEPEPDLVSGALVAEFAPVADGRFVVTRTWRVDGEEITATVLLANPGTTTITGLHREFPPPAPDVSAETAVWEPEPTSLVATIAVFAQITLEPGETFSISYRVATTATDLTAASLLEWYNAWRPEAEALNAVLGESGDFPAPLITDG